MTGSSLTHHVALPDHGCWIGRDENLKVEGVRGQTQTRSKRGETDTKNWVVVWTGHMVALGKDDRIVGCRTLGPPV
ncbi:hypothetical protein DY000_02062837 [Brassica cretica]|uniref:Uncharacterized protein n=1 Tax=Brassica cretica TaxID=69181 RepID=A0ABQ7AXN6_BRACR|nr:hypothetical protein DY000_02062837 [Brassica cretica]